jgi:hypothetical protein
LPGFAEVLRHFDMVLQRRQGLASPVLQVGIVAALGRSCAISTAPMPMLVVHEQCK